jgi:hypothetical protein
MSPFWKTWLNLWCWGVGIFGVVLAGAGLEATTGPTRFILETLSGREIPFMPELHFSNAVLGAVTLGWAITIYAALKAVHQLAPTAATPIWRLIATSGIVWYVVDSALSIATGFGLNAVINTVILAAFLTPMFASGVLAARG